MHLRGECRAARPTYVFIQQRSSMGEILKHNTAVAPKYLIAVISHLPCRKHPIDKKE
jgi:hypothetical protein